MKVEFYTADRQSEWDALVRSSRNGVFLFERGYMDYHRSRFHDRSLMVWRDDGRLVAVMPAHAVDGTLISHRGLSFGGLVLSRDCRTIETGAIWEAIFTLLRSEGYHGIEYREIPRIYHQEPAEADRYFLHRAGGHVIRRDMLSVLDLANRPAYQDRRRRGVLRGSKAGVRIVWEDSLHDYWRLLTETLQRRHQARPVHTLDEIERLRAGFPHQIRLVTARSTDGLLLAGVVFYLSERVAHAQYIASSDTGRACGALDLLFDSVIRELSQSVRYLDFGSSHEDEGRAVNGGLLEFKEGFGARPICYDCYRIDLRELRPGCLLEMIR